MRTARIGTIMPWGGDGNEGFTAANAPRGWIVCDGLEVEASDYPLLFSEIGNTYGGTGTGIFPDYTGKFFMPRLTNRVMVDLEREYLSDPHYQYGQGDVSGTVIDNTGTQFGTLIDGFGTTAVIKTIWSADADIDLEFSNPFLTLTGKYTSLAITDPDYGATITTLGRKLGINHTPSHSHPGNVQTAHPGFLGPAVFRSMNVTYDGDTAHPVCGDIKSVNHTCHLPGTGINMAPSWQNGRTMLDYYGNNQYEDTLPTGDKFQEYINDSGKNYWNQVPATDWHGGQATRHSPQATSQDVNFIADAHTGTFSYTPSKNHQMEAWPGLHPRPTDFGNRRNYYGHSKGVYNNLVDHPENPANYFYVTFAGSDSIGSGVDEISLPAGTDIRTNHGSGADAWVQYDKIHPWMQVDGGPFAKGTQVVQIDRTGTDDTNYVYTIKLSTPTINLTSWQGIIVFKQGTYPSTLSNFHDSNPNDAAFTSHNHGSFDIQMGRGSLSAPATFPVPDISIGSVTPQNLENALNIIVDTAQPSMMVTYLIKAF